jgi:hypothetical protein
MHSFCESLRVFFESQRSVGGPQTCPFSFSIRTLNCYWQPIAWQTINAMFKRVEKRRRKLEQDEELDLDQDMAEILGNPETDSDESDSSESDDTSGNESEAEAELDREADAVQVNEPIGYDSSSEDEGENGHELPLISVRDALNNPLYPISKQSQVMCVVCPGKLLKNTNMALVHTASSASTIIFISHIRA